jgi:uncharacterized protein (TIGR02118 family)
MWKVVFFLRYRDDMDRAEAERRFAGSHAEIVLETPGLLRYVQNSVLDTGGPGQSAGGRPLADAYAAMWFADRDAYLAATQTPQWQRAAEDAGEIFDVDWISGGWAAESEERVKREGLGAPQDGIGTPPGGIKLVGILRYRSDRERDDLNAYWASTHGDIALAIGQLGHYTQNHAIRPALGDSLAFDGFSEAWFADDATYQEGVNSPEWTALAEDGPNLFAGGANAVVVKERVLRG